MGRVVVNLIVLIVMGIILADILTHSAGTKVLFNGLGSLWTTSVGGLLGKTSVNSNTASKAA